MPRRLQTRPTLALMTGITSSLGERLDRRLESYRAPIYRVQTLALVGTV